MKIEEYELGQKVSLYGVIEEINIEDIYDKENTTTLSIKTVTGKINVNPKWEKVTIELVQPKPVVPQMIFDVIESFDENKDYLHQHVSRQPSEVREWLTHNERDFYEAWLAYPNITVEKEKLYRVKLNDHLYFKEFIDSMFPVFVIDDMPGALDDAFIGKEELALKHAREFGGRLEEAKEVTE